MDSGANARVKARPERRHGDVDDGVAERVALRLQRRDRALELLPVVRDWCSRPSPDYAWGTG